LRNIKDWQLGEQDGVVSYQDDVGQQWRKTGYQAINPNSLNLFK